MRTFPKTTVLALLVTAVLTAGYGARAILSSVSTKHLDHSGPHAAQPVSIEFDGLSSLAAYRSQLTRVSPRGNETAMQLIFRDGGRTWHEQKEYVQTIRFYVSRQAARELNQIRLNVGGKQIVTAPPGQSERWEEVPPDRANLPESVRRYVDPASRVYEYRPTDDEFRFSVLPPLRRVWNYVGDIPLSLWALLWALSVVAPVSAVSLIYSRADPHTAARRVAWLIGGAGLVVVLATALRFMNPTRAFAGSFEWAAVLAGGLSVSVLVLLRVLSRDTRLPQPPRGTEEAAVDATRRKTAAIVVAITVGGLVLRLLDLGGYMSDMFNLPAALSLYDTGTYAYPRNTDLTLLIAELMGLFGRSVEVSKIPAVAASTATIPLIYALGRFISRPVGLATAALFAVSPLHIAVADYVREYPINLLIGTAFAFILFSLYRRYSDRRLGFPLLTLTAILIFAVLVVLYSRAASNPTVRALVQSSVFALAPLLLHYFSRHFPRMLRPALILAVVGFVAGAAFLHHFASVFTPGLRLRPDFFRAYLNPLAMTSMQPFSLAAVSPIFIAGLLVAPYLDRRRSAYVDAALLAFWGTIILFSLKLEFGNSERYLYHVSAFHTILLAGGLVWFFERVKTFSKGHWAGLAGAVLLLLVVVNPLNSFQVAVGRVPNLHDIRRPTKLSGRDDYERVVDLMKNHGVTQSTPIIDAARDPLFISVMLDRPVTWNRRTAAGRTYDLGKLIYPVRVSRFVNFAAEIESENEIREAYSDNWRRNIDMSGAAFETHRSGMFVTREYRLFPPEDFRWKDVHFSFVASVPGELDRTEGFSVYRWESLGPRYPRIGDAFTATTPPDLDLQKGM